MTTQRIPARVDTRQAKESVKDLDRTKGNAIQRAAERARSKAAQRARAMVSGLGGFSAVHRVARARAGDVDPWSEALTPYGAAFGQFVDETMGYSASARRSARESVKTNYGRFFGETGNKAAVREAFGLQLALRTEETAGMRILRQDKDFTGPTLTELIAEAIPGYFRLVGKSVEYIVDAFLR